MKIVIAIILIWNNYTKNMLKVLDCRIFLPFAFTFNVPLRIGVIIAD